MAKKKAAKKTPKKKAETKKWENYEQVARDLLDRFADDFGLDRFEGKQKIPGKRSKTGWQIDAKGVREADGGFMIVECRRHTTSKENQEKLAAVAYRIIDSGALGAIYVCPIGFQEGAEKVGAAENIIEVHLTPDSTPTDFVMSFLNKFRVGASTTLFIRGHAKEELVKGPEDEEKS